MSFVEKELKESIIKLIKSEVKKQGKRQIEWWDKTFSTPCSENLDESFSNKISQSNTITLFNISMRLDELLSKYQVVKGTIKSNMTTKPVSALLHKTTQQSLANDLSGNISEMVKLPPPSKKVKEHNTPKQNVTSPQPPQVPKNQKGEKLDSVFSPGIVSNFSIDLKMSKELPIKHSTPKQIHNLIHPSKLAGSPKVSKISKELPINATKQDNSIIHPPKGKSTIVTQCVTEQVPANSANAFTETLEEQLTAQLNSFIAGVNSIRHPPNPPENQKREERLDIVSPSSQSQNCFLLSKSCFLCSGTDHTHKQCPPKVIKLVPMLSIGMDTGK